MIERTRRKLDEARFFYGRLVKERKKKTSRHDPSAFGYYFSAFIQAARSVTWRLGNEEPEKWKAWRPKWESTLSDEDKRLLRFTKTLRNAEVKHGGTDLFIELEELEVRLLMLRTEDFELESHNPAYDVQRRRSLPGQPSPKVFRPTITLSTMGGRRK